MYQKANLLPWLITGFSICIECNLMDLLRIHTPVLSDWICMSIGKLKINYLLLNFFSPSDSSDILTPILAFYFVIAELQADKKETQLNAFKVEEKPIYHIYITRTDI